MRLSRFLLLVTSVTCCSLLYVHQQTEIFRLAYIGQKKSVIFRDSLDKNALLRYNINKNTSLVLIDSRISGYADFQMPDTFRVVKLAKSSARLKDSASIPPFGAEDNSNRTFWYQEAG